MKLSILAFLSTPTPASLLFAHPPLPLFSHTPFLYFVLPLHPTPPSIRVPAQPPLTPHPLNSLHVALFLRSYVSLPFVSDSINLSAYLLSICWFLHSCVPLILCISTQVSIRYPSSPPPHLQAPSLSPIRRCCTVGISTFFPLCLRLKFWELNSIRST